MSASGTKQEADEDREKLIGQLETQMKTNQQQRTALHEQQ